MGLVSPLGCRKNKWKETLNEKEKIKRVEEICKVSN